MTAIRGLVCALCIVMSVATTAAPAKPRTAVAKPPPTAPIAPPPVDAFGQLPAISDVDINPAGTRLAWIDNSGKLARIVIFDLASHREMREVTLPPETIPRRVSWADDGTLLAGVSVPNTQFGLKKGQAEWRRWFAIDANGAEPRMLLTLSGDLERNTGPVVVRRRTSRPGKIFMAARESGPGLFSTLAYNLYE